MRYMPIILVVVFCVSQLALSQSEEAGPKRSPGLHTFNPGTPKRLRELLKHTGDSLHLVSAHRGGPRKGFPENCIETFENTLQHTFAMMEVDPRYTKDGRIVLHHDAKLERTTNGKGFIADLTLKELRQLRLLDPEGNLTAYSIPTLDEALEWARGKTILVLDQKTVPVKARIRKIEEHDAEAYSILIVYSLEDARLCYAMNRQIMMEVMMTSREQFRAFDKTGVPWSHVIAFVGHSPPRDSRLYKMIHARGSSCMAGTSRNIDRQFINQHVTSIESLNEAYHALMDMGIDLVETDIPREVGPLIYGKQQIPPSRVKFYSRPR